MSSHVRTVDGQIFTLARHEADNIAHRFERGEPINVVNVYDDEAGTRTTVIGKHIVSVKVDVD